MSKLKAAGLRTGEKMRRTTITVDHDTIAALKWLRSTKCSEPIAASRLLRDATHQALRNEGHAVVLGEVITLQENAKRIEADFADRVARDFR